MSSVVQSTFSIQFVNGTGETFSTIPVAKVRACQYLVINLCVKMPSFMA